MKIWKRLTALMLAVLMLACAMTGCSSAKESAVLDTMNEFLYACRNLDTDALLNCIAPDAADPIRLLLALYSEATGQDYEDVTDNILEELVAEIFGTDHDPKAFLSTLDITDMEVTVEDDVAYVQCVIRFEVGGEKFVRESTVVLVEELDQWYVAYVDLFR